MRMHVSISCLYPQSQYRDDKAYALTILKTSGFRHYTDTCINANSNSIDSYWLDTLTTICCKLSFRNEKGHFQNKMNLQIYFSTYTN